MARNPRPAPNPERIETITGTAGNDFLVAILGTTARYSGGGGDDYLKGWIRGDVLDGGDGNDQLFDGDGTDSSSGAADTLRGGAGNDRLYSSFGADILDGGAGFDFAQVDLYSSSAAVTSTGASGSGGTLTLSNGAKIIDVESLTLLLGGGSDTISTGSSSDLINAGAGNDFIRSLGGDDTLSGEAGNDVLDGGAGNDFLIGGAGVDILIGGAGADRFVLDQTANGLDRILDFSIAAGDKLYGVFSEVIDDETNRIITDPIGEGLVRVSDTAQGALVEVLVGGSFASSALLIGVTAAELAPTFTVI